MSNPLNGYWANSGINQGDTVLIHSSMRRTFLEVARRGYKPTSEIVIESLLDLVGGTGTLLFPLFNFDFPVTKHFSLLSTSSQMGRVTEDARLKLHGSRTGHPIYSVYAIGQNEKHFSKIDNFSGYGSDSPFAKLRELDGKIAIIDLDDQHSMTFYHHVEEMHEVDYRYHKTFEGEYIDAKGTSSAKKYSLFVRDLDRGVQTDVNQMGQILWQNDLYIGSLPGIGNGMRSVSANLLFERTSLEITQGRALGTLYSIHKPADGR